MIETRCFHRMPNGLPTRTAPINMPRTHPTRSGSLFMAGHAGCVVQTYVLQTGVIYAFMARSVR